MASNYAATDWKLGGCALFGGLAAIAAWWVWSYESADDIRARLEREAARDAALHAARAGERALATCQAALRRASRDPETAIIPDVGPMKGGGDHRFLWNQYSRPVRMRNGLGLEVPAIALCVVDEKTERIKLLTLDGATLVSSSTAKL